MSNCTCDIQHTQKWSELGFRDKASYFTALSSFCLGWTLIFVGLLLPPTGKIDPTVITAFGTALIYCGGIFGVSLYIKSNNSEIFNKIMNEVNDVVANRIQKHNKK